MPTQYVLVAPGTVRSSPGRGPALVAALLALVACFALASRSSGHMQKMAALALQNQAETQSLLAIPGSGSEGVALPQHSITNYCTLAGTVNKVSPPDFYCTDPDGSVDSCHDCTGDCLSPAAALSNRDLTGQITDDSSTFVGWNPQGAADDFADYYIDFDLGGRGATIKGLLWANAGDMDNDPANIKLWSSDDGVTYELVETIDVTALQNTTDITVVPVANDEVRAKYWRINPGGITLQPIPRVIGLCNTVDCSSCLYEDINVPEQGYNAFAAIKPAECYEGAPNGNIYCTGNYDSDKELNKNLHKSYTIPIYRDDGYKR